MVTKKISHQTQIIIRLSQKLKKRIIDLANKNSRSMNSEIVFRLKTIIEDEENMESL